jgi:hypothetical protein
MQYNQPKDHLQEEREELQRTFILRFDSSVSKSVTSPTNLSLATWVNGWDLVNLPEWQNQKSGTLTFRHLTMRIIFSDEAAPGPVAPDNLIVRLDLNMAGADNVFEYEPRFARWSTSDFAKQCLLTRVSSIPVDPGNGNVATLATYHFEPQSEPLKIFFPTPFSSIQISVTNLTEQTAGSQFRTLTVPPTPIYSPNTFPPGLQALYGSPMQFDTVLEFQFLD